MVSPVSLWIVDGFVLFTLLVVAPSMSIAIAHAAWKGKPRTFDREKYFASFVACLAASAFLMVCGADAGGRPNIPVHDRGCFV
jgi:hypothetical protein